VTSAVVVGTFIGARHSFSKQPASPLILLEGRGVQGDAHCGVTVKHRSRVARDPTQPNLRQVHLLHQELFEELAVRGFGVKAGDLGENITTAGLDLPSLPRDTLLHVGAAVLKVTGLRNPCSQLNDFLPGLIEAVVERAADGSLVRKAGVMAVVVRGGAVRPMDRIEVQLPPGPHVRLEPV
jgi:MOSC domain-containing protein YiiM